MVIEQHSENKVVLCTKDELYGMFLNYFGGNFNNFNNFELKDANIEYEPYKNKFTIRFILSKNL
jgi:hypothetical protein